MRRIAVFALAFLGLFCLIGCRQELSLTADSTKALIDTSYYSDVVFEEQKDPSEQNLAPFSQLDTKQDLKEDSPKPFFDRFSMLLKFKGDKSQNTVYVNGVKYKKGETLTMSVLIHTNDKTFTAHPTLVFMKHGEKSSTEIYNSIRINPDSLRVPHLKDIDADAEFGKGYFAYSLSLDNQTKNGIIDCSKYPRELFSIDFSFAKPGHYTVAVIDSYKNDGKYTENLSLLIEQTP